MKTLTDIMKTLAVACCAVGITYMTTTARADAPNKQVYEEKGAILTAAALNAAASTRTTTAFQTRAFNQILLFVDFTHSAATDVQLVCNARYDEDTATLYEYLVWTCTAGTCTGLPWIWKVEVTGDRQYVVPVPWMGWMMSCVVSGTAGGAGDLVTIKALGGVM